MANCVARSPDVEVDYEFSEATSPTRHQKMANALTSVNRDMSYFICQWGMGTKLGEWALPIGNSYPMNNDIIWCLEKYMRITNHIVPFYRSTRTWAYPDMECLCGCTALGSEACPPKMRDFTSGCERLTSHH
ncbi:hypothetical protein GGS21DRAFT_96854 [Xylaria nigripes]|nr:hypothetical protein GGS21DRAFT_96854 [Xylaria nigripes]